MRSRIKYMKRHLLILLLLVLAAIGAFIYGQWPKHWANHHSVHQLTAISALRDFYAGCLVYEKRTGNPPTDWDDFDTDWAEDIQTRFLRQSDADEMVVNWDAFAHRHTNPQVVFVESPGVTKRYGQRAHDRAWIKSMWLLACGQAEVIEKGLGADSFPGWFRETSEPYSAFDIELLSADDVTVLAHLELEFPGLLPSPWKLEQIAGEIPLPTGEGVAHWTLTDEGDQQERFVDLMPRVVDHNLQLTIRGTTGTWVVVTDAGIEAQGALRVTERTGESTPGLPPGVP